MQRVPVWLRVVILVVIVLLLIAWALPRLVPVERFRGPLQNSLSRATGRQVVLGRLSAHVLPIGFGVAGFQILNPPNFPPGNLVQAEALQGRVAFWPLLHGQVRVTSLELDRPVVTLLTNARGQSNGQVSVSAPGQTGAAGGGAPTEIDALNVKQMQVASADVGANGVVAPPSFQLSGLNLQLRHLRLDSALVKTMAATANLAGVRLSASQLAVPVVIRSGQVSLRDGALQGACVASLGPAGEIALQLRSPKIEQPPALFAIHASALRLDRLLAPAAPGGRAAPRAGATPRGRAAAAISGPGTLLAQGTFDARRLAWGAYLAENARSDLRIFPDRVEAAPITLDFAGGKVDASFVLNHRTVPSLLTASINAAGLQLARLAASSSMGGRLSGTGGLQLQLAGPLGNLPRDLTGVGRFQFTQIEMKNSPAVKSLAQLGALRNLLAGNAGSELPIGLVRGDLHIANARVASRLIQAQTGLGQADLHGSVGFDQTLAYSGTIHLGVNQAGAAAGGAASPAISSPGGVLGAITGVLAGKSPVQGGTMPISITGTLANPHIAPG